MVPLEEMRAEYYAIRGWDTQTGLPRANNFDELGIPEIWDGLVSAPKKSGTSQ